MPLTVLENPIELSNFTAGWVAEAEEAGVPPNGLLKAVNLLPDTVTGTVVTRSGFKRATAGFPQGYQIYTLRPYTTKGGIRYVMAVVSNNSAGADNVRVYAINTADMSMVQVSPTGKTWASSDGRHWGAVIDGKYYGGTEGSPIYSWDGTTWVEDESTPSFPTFGGADRPADYAFRAGDVVQHTYTVNAVQKTKAFQLKHDQPESVKIDKKVDYDGIRFDEWANQEKVYTRGDKVSRKIGGYWRSYKCIKEHEPTTLNRPGDGTGTGADAWTKFWSKITVPAPTDPDGRLVRRWWQEVPDAPRTRVAIWHGNRLWARDDGRNRRQTAIYSRLAKVGDEEYSAKGLKKDASVGEAGNPDWDPADWRPGGAPGAGFQPFETEEGDDIQGFASLGYYLLVLKRNSVHVVAGTNPETWIVRTLAPTGTVGERSFTEHEGYVYFISSEGFHRTDGTVVEPVPGSEKIANWLRETVKWSEDEGVVLRSYKGFVWISLATYGEDNPNLTLVYEPISQSFWPQDFGMLDTVVQKRNGIDRMFFSQPTKTAEIATYAWTGTPHQSTSTRTMNAVTTYNYCPNPGFEAANVWGKPHLWERTHIGGDNNSPNEKVDIKVSAEAARDRKRGMHLMNKRESGSTAGSYAGWEGAYFLIGEPDTATYEISAYVRVPHRKKSTDPEPRTSVTHPNRSPFMPYVKFLLGENTFFPTNYVSMGDGWWKISLQYAGEVLTRRHGILVAPDTALHVDMCRVRLASEADGWFDGDHGYGLADTKPGTGGVAFLQQYAHPEANQTDDPGYDTYQPQEVSWLAQTAWLPFGAVREERRIRRIWSLIKGSAISVGIRTFINYKPYDNTHNAVVQTIPEGEASAYIEGRLPRPMEAYAVSFQVEGNTGPAALLGVACDSEPLRIRYGG